MTSLYEYKPLDESGRQIRLLTLLPTSSFDQKLQCVLQHVSLNSKPEYEALSYVWGKPRFTHEIDLNGARHYVTENLASAMRHLRHPNAPRILWVDALCIDQSNQAERSSQVEMMRDIFQSCTCDLAWLGPFQTPNEGENLLTEADFALGIALFKNIQRHDIHTLQAMESEWESEDRDRGRRTNLRFKEDGVTKYMMTYKERALLGKVFRWAPLWSRIWIVQELSCAPKVQLIAGTATLDWALVGSYLNDEKYADAFHGVFGHGTISSVVREIFEFAKTIEQQRSIMRRVETDNYISSLMDVLARFRYAKATDPRDMIYGLLGLVSEEHPVMVDYSKTTAEVFADVTAAIINLHGNLDVICQSPWESFGSQKSAGLPSWAADLMKKQASSTDDQILFAQRGIFSAGSPTCDIPCHVLGGVVLRVRGCIIDKISPVLWKREKNWRTLHGYMGLPSAWMEAYFQERFFQTDRGTYKISGESLIQAFWRTLVMDCKAFPISRLSEDDILHDSQIFDLLLDPETPKENEPLWKLRSYGMWSRNCHEWTFFTTDDGLFVMARDRVEKGDIVVTLDGAKVPVILRQIAGETSSDRFEIVCPAYVHGCMDNGALARFGKNDVPRQEFLIV
jgi:hypothetical protein